MTGADANGWRVKPLEWRKGYCDDQVTIHQASFGGLYQIRVLNGEIWVDWPNRQEPNKFADIEAARSAVQADHDRRIQSAIIQTSENGWRDISTANTDDDSLLLLACANWAHSVILGNPVPVKVGGFWDGSWHVFGASWKPTHWQPLPGPPLPVEFTEATILPETLMDGAEVL